MGFTVVLRRLNRSRTKVKPTPTLNMEIYEIRPKTINKIKAIETTVLFYSIMTADSALIQ